VKAMEPLSSFQERVGSSARAIDETLGRLLPSAWEARRREARELGVAVTADAWGRLCDWANRLGVSAPPPAASATPSARAPTGAL
jgi:hypothetical protein